MSREVPALQRHLHAVLAREIVRDHGVMMLLGSMRAEERLAAFLSTCPSASCAAATRRPTSTCA